MREGGEAGSSNLAITTAHLCTILRYYYGTKISTYASDCMWVYISVSFTYMGLTDHLLLA